jgi:site-specific DNA-methyltransferase (adenine-specific)
LARSAGADRCGAGEYLAWLEVRFREVGQVLSPTGSLFVAIHWFTRDRKRFTFNVDAIRVPSARQLRYHDKRANPKGKVPDNVWVLRPQDDDRCFLPQSDAWHAPRVAGTFRERVNHVCQMPLTILERIVLLASNPGVLVLDPFAGTGTALVAAKRLGRRWLSIEKCPATADLARMRLEGEPQSLFSFRPGIK